MINYSISDYKNQEVKIKEKFKGKMMENKKVISLLKQCHISEQRLERMEMCGRYLTIQDCNCMSRVTRASFCRERVCPMCQWRRSLRFTADTYKILHEVTANDSNPQFIFITLTIKNVTADNLSDGITNLLEGFKRLCKTTVFRNAFKGYIRSLEVTYNKRDKTYHPHIHALCYCHNNYFDMRYNKYISKEALIKLWRKSARIDYDPSVKIDLVKDKEERTKGDEESVACSAIPEILKYAIKYTDLTYSADVLKTFMIELKGRRLIAFGGILKTIKQSLGIKDSDSNDTPLTDDEVTNKLCPVCGQPIITHILEWKRNNNEYATID